MRRNIVWKKCYRKVTYLACSIHCKCSDEYFLLDPSDNKPIKSFVKHITKEMIERFCNS